MKAQHVWAEAATMAGIETVSKSNKGGVTMWRKSYPGRISGHAFLLALIVLTIFTLPVYAVKKNLPAGAILEDEVNNAASGDVLVLDGAPAPINVTIPVNKTITIQGYDDNPCEILPTDRVIGGQPDTCYAPPNAPVNADFEAGDTGWLFTAIPSPLVPVVPDVSYTPPTSADIITQEGEPEEGAWHAVYELDPRGAPVELQYQDPIPTLPQVISEEVRWATSATNLCNIMDLTTESTYTLPVLPLTLVENFHADSFPVTLLSNHFHLWLQVPQYSGHTDDKIEVFINNLLVATADGVMLNAWKTAGIWTRWHVTLTPALPAGPVDVRIQVTTRTDVANPTLVLFGAINVNDTVAPGAPSTPDSINLLDYSSNLGAMETYAKSIFDLPALGIVLPPPVDTQTFLARAGGLGAPYIAASIRAATPVAPGTDSVTLMFENHEFGSILLSSLPIVPSACGRYIFPLPSHLMNVPGRPRIRVALTPAGSVTRVLVDDFTLSYVTKALEVAYPALAAASNIIPNGGFEKGNFPFLIESPIASPVNCPHISEVILPTGEACQGGYAAEFKPMLNLLLWVRLPQTSGLPSDRIEVIVDDGSGNPPIGIVDMNTLTVDGTTKVGLAWGIVSFPFIPATSDFTVILRSAIATNTETPSLFLLGAMDIQFGPPVPTALPGPTALKIASLTATDIATVTVIPAAIDPATDLPPRIFNAPSVAVSGQSHVLRFGGIGTTLKFQAKLMSPLVPGNSTLSVMVDGVEQESILDADLSTNCALQVISPDRFPTETAKVDFTFSLMSNILPNAAPFDQTEFFVDNVCLSYCAIQDTIAAQLGLGMPCDRNQLSEGDFEGTPSNEWTVVPAVLPFTDIVQSAESCLGALPNTAAVFKGIQTDVPTWELALEQAGIVMPATFPLDLELKFRLNILKDGGATPGKFTVEVDSNPVFTRSSDAGGTGAYNEYTVNINGVRGMTVPIRFVATIPRSTTPPAFALDHIEICESGALGGPLFRVTAGGELILKSVTLEQAATGVQVMDGIAKLLQTKMRDLDGTAVTVTGGQAFLASTVLHGNRDNGVHVNGGTVAVLQSTIRDNGGAGVLVDSGAAHIAASLLDNNGQGIVRNGGTAFSYVNWVQNNDNAATAVATFANMDATVVKPQYSDSPWRGKLKMPLQPTSDTPTLGTLVSRVITSSTLPNLGGWARDFECDLRPAFDKAQVGADHVDPTPVECPTDSLGADQQPHLPTDTWTSHSSNNASYVMEQTPNVSFGSVNYVTWWGIWLDGGGAPCTPPAGVTVFEIATYDGPGGTETAVETVKPVGTPLTAYTYGGATLYKYQHSFDQDVFSRDQYLSIRAMVNAADNCWFHWISSADGATAAVDAAGNPLNVNLSLCISEYTAGDDCSGTSFIAQPPVTPLTPWPAAQQSTDVSPVYERVNTGANSIGVIEFWGVWLTDDTTAAPCTPPMTPDLVVKYVNNTDLADAAITAADVVTAYGKLLPPDMPVAGDAFTAPDGGLAPMYRYAFVPQDDPVTAPDESMIALNGWLSVQQTGGATDSCRFYWVQSNYGSNTAVRWDGPGNTPVTQSVSMSLCLGLTPGGSTISGCSVTPAILGKDKTGTLELTGTNLFMMQQIVLVPEMALPGTPGDSANLSLHIDLLTSPITQSITYSGEMGTTMRVRFRLPGTFNTAADGTTPICTDGRASFETTPPGATTCDILIDTIEPTLITLPYANSSDAATGSPSITAILPPRTGTMPAMWVPGDIAVSTPKNLASDILSEDMHVYLNAGSNSVDPCETAAPINNPISNLIVTLNAYFHDPIPPGYTVEIAGFGSTDFTVSPHDPADLVEDPDYLDDIGTAQWANRSGPIPFTGSVDFDRDPPTPIGQDMSVSWNVEYISTAKYFQTSFKLAAVDLAGNKTVTDNMKSITLHWLYCTRAKFQNNVDMTVENPEVYWRLDRATPDLPDAKPECAPLAKFMLFTADSPIEPANLIALVGTSSYRMDTLRGSSMFGSFSLRQLLDQYQGTPMCLVILGADETGNVQHDLGAYGTTVDLYTAGVDFELWMNGERRTPNLAVDTTLRMELFHQKYNITGRYRNYGAAQRIPLPPLAEACDTRVNADVAMKALVPTADAPVAISNGGILWKLYKEGALVARGTAPMAVDGTTGFNLMDQLELCTPVGTVADLGDYNPDTTFKINLGQRLPWDSFIAYPPVAADYAIPPYANDEIMDCPSLGVFDFRLGDEGRQPPRANPNMPSQRRREVQYTFTAQTVVLYRYIDPATGTSVEDVVIDATPATNNFSIYVREVEEQLRDETPVREFGR